MKLKKIPFQLVNIWRTAKGKGIDFESRPKKSKGFLSRFIDLMLWYLRYGEVLYFYYFYGFDYKHRKEQNEYMGESYYLKLLDQKNKKLTRSTKGLDYRVATYDKFLANNYLESVGIPVAHNEALIKNNVVYWDDGETGDLHSILDRGFESVFIKPIYGSYGAGIIKLFIENGTFIRGERETTIPELQAELQGKIWIIQQTVKQHKELNKFNSSAVHTLRLITLQDDGEPSLFTSYLRIGTGNNYIDNWESGSVRVYVNPIDGGFSEVGHQKNNKYLINNCSKHPDSKIAFAGFKLPYFNEAVNLAIKAHQFYYGRIILGFDIAITDDGPVVIEVNCRPTLMSSVQMYHQSPKTTILAAKP